MKTLVARLAERRAVLLDRLNEPDGLRGSVDQVLEELERIQLAYVGDLTVPQARVATPMLALLKSAVGMLTAARRTSVWHRASPDAAGSDRGSTFDGTAPKWTQGAICFGLVVGLLFWTTRTWVAWPAVILVLALAALEWLFWRRSGGLMSRGLHRVSVNVDARELLDKLTATLDVIDRSVPAAAGDAGESGKPGRRDPIESIPELIAAIQDLVAESQREDAEMTIRRAKLLPGVLSRYGVSVAQFDADRSRSEQADRFDFEPSLQPDADGFRTLKPALLKGDRVLARGRVVTPAEAVT